MASLFFKRSHSSGKMLKRFAKMFDLVYFGSVSQQDDDHKVIRGITASSHHKDEHFIVGTVHGRDVTLVERTTTLGKPDQTEKVYTWVIAAIPLDIIDIPRIFLDGAHHDDVFYAHFFTTLANFHNVNPLLVGHDTLFHQRFKTFGPADRQQYISELLTSNVTSMLAHNFADFDYEITEEEVYVYSNKPSSEQTIEKMVRVGLWLADQLQENTARLKASY
jgi:hypothetical protein